MPTLSHEATSRQTASRTKAARRSSLAARTVTLLTEVPPMILRQKIRMLTLQNLPTLPHHLLIPPSVRRPSRCRQSHPAHPPQSPSKLAAAAASLRDLGPSGVALLLRRNPQARVLEMTARGDEGGSGLPFLRGRRARRVRPSATSRTRGTVRGGGRGEQRVAESTRRVVTRADRPPNLGAARRACSSCCSMSCSSELTYADVMSSFS